MPKVGVQVGEDFPAEEVNPSEQNEKAACGSREESRRRHEEWHRRARAFRDDVRRAAHRHFGEHSFIAHNMFMLRVLLAVAVLVFLVALVPRMLLLGILLAAVVFIAIKRHRFHHHHFATPPGV